MLLAPLLASRMWPDLLGLMEEYKLEKWHLYFFGTWAWNASLVLLTNLVMWAIYEMELPFFERYKIT